MKSTQKIGQGALGLQKKSTPEKSQRSNSLKGQRLKLREEVNYRMMQVNDVSNKG